MFPVASSLTAPATCGVEPPRKPIRVRSPEPSLCGSGSGNLCKIFLNTKIHLTIQYLCVACVGVQNIVQKVKKTGLVDDKLKVDARHRC